MKPTPLYELAVATKDRPKVFRLIVTGSFITSLLAIFICAGTLLTEQKNAEQGSTLSHKQTIYNTKLSSPLGIAVAGTDAKRYTIK